MDNKRVYFDNNDKLVVETDNGIIKDNGKECAVKLDGTFTIDDKNVAKLLAHFGKTTLKCKHWIGFYYSIVTNNDEVREILSKEYENTCSLKKDLIVCREELDSIKSQIREFNKSRRFYERKFEYENKD